MTRQHVQISVAWGVVSFSFLVFQIFCEERYMFYSNLNNHEIENSSLALFDLEGVSRSQCGSLCLGEQCCKEFMYDENIERCVGIHFEGFHNIRNTNLILSSDGMLKYRKGCETGWLEFKGHCYYKGHTKVNWPDAKRECSKMCSYLIEIESKEEAEWISATFLENVTCGSDIFFDCTAWTGLNDLDIEGTYVWDHSNASLNFSNWHDLEPSLLNPSAALTKDCIDILRGGVWNDRTCSYSKDWVICEKSFEQ